MPTFSNLLPGLYVAALATLLAAALRRWFDPVPGRCWVVWGAALAPVFAPVLFAGRVLLPLGYLTQVPPFTHLWSRGGAGPPPGNLIQSDLVLLILPWLVRVRAAFAAGTWPLWNHLCGAGEPLLANPQSQALQPLAWLALPFPAASAVAVTAALKVLLAFVFTYLLLRRQGFSLAPALWASLAFGLAGFLQLWLGWPLSGSAALLPLLLYGIVLVAERGWRRDCLFTAGAVAVLATVGHPETEMHVAALAGAFALSRLAALPAGQRRQAFGRWLVAAALGAALAAPALLPAADFIPQSLRASILTARQASIRASGPRGDPRYASRAGALSRLLPVVAPNAFGNSRLGVYWGVGNTIEDASSFTGSAAFLALLIACWPLARGARSTWHDAAFGSAEGQDGAGERTAAGPDGAGSARAAAVSAGGAHAAAVLPDGALLAPRRLPQERLMLATALAAALVLACPPALVTFFNALPLLHDSLAFHSRVALLLNFAIAYVAACTWERWQRGELRRVAVLPAAVLLAGATIWAYQAHPGPAQAWAATPVRLASLALHLAVLAGAAVWLVQAPPLLRVPSRLAGLALVWGGALLVAGELLAIHAPANPPSPAALYFPSVPAVEFVRRHLDPWHRMAGIGPALRPNFPSVYGLADPRSANPLKPTSYLEATRRINRFPNRPADGFVRPEDPLYGLLGVEWVMTAPQQPPGLLAAPLRLAFRSPDAWVYARPGALARLFLPAAAALCRDQAWAACTAGIGDFAAAAAVRDGPPLWQAAAAPARLDLLTLAAAEIHAHARLPAARLLATSVLQDGGWKLLLAGHRQPTTLANGPFVAAWLPAGELDVDLLYRPRGFVLGLLLAAAALAAGAAAWVPPPRRPLARRDRSQATTAAEASPQVGGPQPAESSAAMR
jgi:hypothetical protein